MKLRRYSGVRGHRNVAAILSAVEASGGSVVKPPDPTSAPFEMTVRTRSGEHIELVCYAFTANKYNQGGRPEDEHRFQIKYKSDFKSYHNLFFDLTGKKVTLFFGVHHACGLFVAVDPRMHDPTWFSASVEFKTHDLEEAHDKGWHGWQRERVIGGRRKQERPDASFETEAVCAFRPEFFLRYVAFERAARGLDPGERLLLADRIARTLSRREPTILSANAHPLEIELGLPAREILDIIGGAFRLKVAVRGGVAERHLETHLRALPGISEVHSIDKDGEPDFRLVYRKREFYIECKNVLRRSPKNALAQVDFQKTRASQGDKCSRYYDPSKFDILAACLHPVTENWEFRFRATRKLATHPRCPDKLASNVPILHGQWQEVLPLELDELLR